MKSSIVFIVLSAAFYAGVTVVLKYQLFSVSRPLLIFTYSTMMMVISGIALTASGEAVPWMSFIKSVAFMWIFCVAMQLYMGDYSYFTALKFEDLDPMIASSGFTLITVFVGIYETIIAKKIPSTPTIIASALIVAAIVIISLEKKE